MDTVTAARELGKAIQADKRYAAYNAAKTANDNDKALQELIGEFNLLRQNLGLEMNKSDKDDERVKELNAKAQETYAQIMENKNMVEFSDAKSEMEKMINEVNGIIELCCDGDDPDTCAYVPSCGGECGGCAGCG